MKKRILGIILCLVMALSLLPAAAFALDADKIYEVTAAGIKQPVFGETADFSTTLTVPAGAHYTASLAEAPVSPGGSYARNDVTYTYKVVYTPAAGYSFPSTSQIDATLSGVARDTYTVEKGIASDGTLTVWYYFDFGFLHYTLNQFKYAIPDSRVGLAIDPIALPTDTGTIKGGTAPYTFEKVVNEPHYATLDWVKVSSNGIITGTPTRAADRTSFGVRVRITDATGKSCIFTVGAGRTIESPYLLGDVNNDGKVNQKDVARLRQYLADSTAYPMDAPQNADVNNDGKVNQKDVARLRQYLADPTSYPLG